MTKFDKFQSGLPPDFYCIWFSEILSLFDIWLAFQKFSSPSAQ